MGWIVTFQKVIEKFTNARKKVDCIVDIERMYDKVHLMECFVHISS